jgi:preprotein translocase subunit SecD
VTEFRVGRIAVLAVLVALTTAACSRGSDASESRVRVEVTLRAQSLAGGQVRSAELDQALAILQDRLDRAGIGGAVTHGSSSRVFVEIDRARPGDGQRVVELSMVTGLLEIYDLERNLVRPSIDASGFPVATESRSILGTPPKTVVLECGIGEAVCPGVLVERPRTNFYYLVRYDPPRAPELDGSDVRFDAVRQDFDTTTGEPIVTMQFTNDGADEFGKMTNALADRGKALFNSSGGSGDPTATFQHLAIVLDGEIKAWPSIDWEQYPNGIHGRNGAQINGMGDVQEARNIALALQTGALPVRFEFLARRETGS